MGELHSILFMFIIRSLPPQHVCDPKQLSNTPLQFSEPVALSSAIPGHVKVGDEAPPPLVPQRSLKEMVEDAEKLDDDVRKAAGALWKLVRDKAHVL